MLTRTGHESGARDATLVRERWPDGDRVQVFMAGTRLHALEGVVKVEPVAFEIDPERGHYFGEFIWHHASEDDEHIASYGVGTEPACWMQLGYAMGYVTGMMGRLVVFREVECRSMGASLCRVIGKTAEAWGDISEDLRYLNAQAFLSTAAHGGAPRAVLGSAALADGNTSDMVGVSSAFKAACHMLSRVAPTKATVLFTGESGVGKEMFASTLHRISPRVAQPFVAVNCAAIPESLVESELFGVERGAFTGATQSRPGRFERADGGTLFLDQIGTLSLASQGKLLRALQQGEVERVGGTRTLKVDVRVIAATNVDLRAEVQAGRFREDLFYRLDVCPIHLPPPLRDRREDIPLLLSHFLHVHARNHGRQLLGYTPRAVKALMGYGFPGNIRELQNMVERGVIDLPHMLRKEQISDGAWFSLSAAGALAAEHREDDDDAVAPAAEAGSLFERLADPVSQTLDLAQLERALMDDAVSRAGGNLAAAARMLGFSRAQLAYRLKQTSAIPATRPSPAPSPGETPR